MYLATIRLPDTIGELYMKTFQWKITLLAWSSNPDLYGL